MTKAATLQTSKLDVREIPLDLLDDSPFNPRKTFDTVALRELAVSIKQSGITQTLLVRPQPNTEGLVEERFEIVAGHRRVRAAQMAEFETVPCYVREMSDAEARDAALIDNLQRVDVPALEEAEGFGEMLERYLSIPAIAAKVGKEQAYVHSAGSKKSVYEVIKETLDRRKVNADEDDDDIERAVRRARWRQEWEPQSVQRLKEHIECTSGEQLARAPWPMEEDWLVLDAGSCLDCEMNTKANAPLCGDLDMGVAVCKLCGIWATASLSCWLVAAAWGA